MNGLLLVASSGIGAGCLHAISGPDHLAAICPLAVVSDQRAALVGASWGLGHASGAGLVGAIAIVLGARFPIDIIAMLAERAVGVLLVTMGIWGAIQIRRAAVARVQTQGAQGARAAMHVGLFHGVAGSAQLVGVLPALFVPSLTGKLLYLGAFGLGSACAMSLFAHVVSTTCVFVHQRVLLAASSAVSVILGLVWMARSF